MGFAQIKAIEDQESLRLLTSGLLALLVCLIIVIFVRLYGLLPTSQKGQDISAAPILEAELVEQKEPPHLYEKKQAFPAPAPARETTLSKDLSQGQVSSKQSQDLFNEQNKTAPGSPPPVLNRGPQVESSPSPKIPSYLKNQNLKTQVLIEFLVKSNGQSIPSLLGSSGNEELDALALNSAKKWIFRPALQNGQPVEAKVRLRINFEVD